MLHSKRPRALVTGVTGQDGSYLADLLLAKGYEVHGVTRRSATDNTDNIRHITDDPALNNERFFLHCSDLNDPFDLQRLLTAARPHEVYNLAGQSHVGLSFKIPKATVETNALGVLNLLEAIRALNLDCRFYQAGSSEMFGGVQNTPQNESTPFHPRSPYGTSKVCAHWLTINYRESYGLFACNGILFNHESPRRGERFVTRKTAAAAARIKLGLQHKLVLGNLDAKRDWGYAPEYVEAMWLMLQQDKPDDYVVATGKAYSVQELVATAFECVDLDWREHVVQDPAFFRPAEVDSLLGDATKAKEKLGWQPRTDFKGLISTIVETELERYEKLTK